MGALPRPRGHAGRLPNAKNRRPPNDFNPIVTLADHDKWAKFRIEQVPDRAVKHGTAKENTKWVKAMGERQHDPDRERVFVRQLSGAYSLKDELGRLRAMPRVIKGKELKLDGGPQHFSRHYVEPEDGRTQTLHIHLEEYAPGGTTQKHGHVNEAAFYILDGAGYEIHDGVRYDWKAGDVAIVHNNCVHQHFNASPKEPARALVIKTKPMYLFMNMLFQHTVQKRPTTPSPTQGNFVPRQEEESYNHPQDEELDA
jgi:quercetin dioxygenase-like cupin family protein